MKLSLRRIFVAVLGLALAGYGILCAWVTINQRSFIYHPPQFDSKTLDQMGQEAKLTRWKDAAGQNIGWKRLTKMTPAKGQLFITYGNGSYATGVSHYVDAVRSSGLDVYILEYPGYADRPGSPSQASFFLAANEAFTTLPTDMPTYLLGESLGTGVAAYLAGKYANQVKGIVLLAPYDRLVSVAHYVMPWFPVNLLLIDRFDSVDHLRHYHGPVAVFTGTADRVVPERFGLRLFHAYEGPKQLWEFPGDDHGDVFGRFDQKWPEVEAFWKKSAFPASAPREPASP